MKYNTQVSIEKHKEIIDRHSVISFDLFDTLIERPVLAPAELFNLMTYSIESSLNIKQFDFKTIRQLAEKNAYKQIKGTLREEITLTDIYEQFQELTQFSNEQIETIALIEKQYELNYSLKKNSSLLLDYALTSSKEVILISDTYFDREFILTLLKKHNLKIKENNLFLSSELNLKKHSGNIYPKIISILMGEGKIASNTDIVHFGDNEESDVVNARANGIYGELILSNSEKYLNSTYYESIFKPLEAHSHFHHKFLHGALSKQEVASANPVFNNLEDVGYFGFGPLILGFAQWLIQKSIRDNVQHLYFLARDGKIMKDAYDLLSQYYDKAPKSYYILASRKSSNTTKLTNFYEIHNILKIPYTKVLLTDLFEQRFSVDLSLYEDVVIKHQFSLHSVVSQEKDNSKIVNLLKELAPVIFAKAKEEKELYAEYLQQNNLPNNEKSAVVDIGYSGTMQAAISNIINQEIHGYYLITFYEAIDRVYQYNNSVDAYLTNFDNRSHSNNGFIKKIPLYETFFSSEKTSFLSFTKENGVIVPTFQDEEKNEAKRIAFVRQVQGSALLFIKDFTSTFNQDISKLYFDPSIVIAPLNYFLSNKKENETLLQDVYFEDKYTGAVLHGVGSYYQEIRMNFVRKQILRFMGQFLSNKKRKKLNKQPAKFFLDSKKKTIKIVGKYVFGVN